jgi:hypothetical protein
MLSLFFAAALSGPLTLVCMGAGAANKVSTATAWASDSDGNSGQATIMGQRSQQFADQVDLVIDGENSRVRMPRTMLPTIRGGEDGWFKLKSLKVGESTITGSVAINPINNPKIFVDRRTGTVNISGKAGDYSGQCQKIDAEQAPRF